MERLYVYLAIIMFWLYGVWYLVTRGEVDAAILISLGVALLCCLMYAFGHEDDRKEVEDQRRWERYLDDQKSQLRK